MQQALSSRVLFSLASGVLIFIVSPLRRIYACVRGFWCFSKSLIPVAVIRSFINVLLKLLMQQRVFILDLPDSSKTNIHILCVVRKERAYSGPLAVIWYSVKHKDTEKRKTLQMIPLLWHFLDDAVDHTICHLLKILIMSSCEKVIWCTFSVFLQYKTHFMSNLIALTLHSKDHVWQRQKIREGIQILFPKGFSWCKCNSFNIPSPQPSTLSSPLKPK